MNLVLTPLTIIELKTFFDDDALAVITYFLKKSIVSQPEKLPKQDDLPIHIPKEHIEQWVVQALGATPIGAGSYPVDVITSDWGADVKMLFFKRLPAIECIPVVSIISKYDKVGSIPAKARASIVLPVPGGP